MPTNARVCYEWPLYRFQWGYNTRAHTWCSTSSILEFLEGSFLHCQVPNKVRAETTHAINKVCCRLCPVSETKRTRRSHAASKQNYYCNSGWSIHMHKSCTSECMESTHAYLLLYHLTFSKALSMGAATYLDEFFSANLDRSS